MKLLKIICLCLLSYSFIACEEEFVLQGKFRQKYMLNCILRGDSLHQTATISANYPVGNFNDVGNTKDPSIENALIRVFHQDSVKIFKDTIKARNGNDLKYLTDEKFYIANKFSVIPSHTYEIEARMPNGIKLKGTTKVPPKVLFRLDKVTEIIPVENSEFAIVNWYKDDINDIYYDPSWFIVYQKEENGKLVRYTKEVPSSYTELEGKFVGNFPTPSFKTRFTVNQSAIDRAMQEISGDDPDKSNYVILSNIIEVATFDKNLTAYFALSIGGDEVSINPNEVDFTNIENGLGIFGSYVKNSLSIKFTSEYIRSFGYKPGL